MATTDEITNLVKQYEGQTLTAEERRRLAPRGGVSGNEYVELLGADPNADEVSSTNSLSVAQAAEQLGVPQATILRLRRAGSTTVTGESGLASENELSSFAERSALGSTATGTGQAAASYWDESRGVEVFAPGGKHFELLPGGGVKVVDGPAPTGAGAPASSLFTQGTQGAPGGGMQATPGFKEEQLGITPAAGKTIKRTGRSGFNPATGVDVPVGPDEIFIEYDDGTFEVRKHSGINTAGETKSVNEAGQTAQELGITRQTEIKGPNGEITRAPMSAAEALAQAKTPEEKDAVIQAEGLTSTANLEFIGNEYTDQKTGVRRIAKDGYAFYQEPGSDTILERPVALQSLAKQSTSPSVLAEREAAQAMGPSFSDSLKSSFAGLGLEFDEAAAIQALRDRPIPSVQELYTEIQKAQGVQTIQAQLKQIQDEMKVLDDKYANDRAGIDENPWLSETLRNRKQDALAGKYEVQKAQLTARQQLNQSLLQDARQEAQFIAGNAIQQANADREFDMQALQLAFERADQRFNAQMELAKFEQGQEEFEYQKSESAADREFRKSESAADRAFQEKQFNEDIRQFNVQQARLGSSGGGGTAGERALSRLGAISGQVENILSSDRNLGEQGSFTTIAAYRNARNSALNAGVSPDDFDSIYGNTLSPYDRLTYGIGTTTNISQLSNLQPDDTLDFDSF